MKELSLVIPTFNERDNVGRLVHLIDEALGDEDYEIVFVDDDSPDGTAGEVKTLAGAYPVSVIVRKGRRGLASAVVEGFAHVTGRVIGVMDADLQHPPVTMRRLLHEVRGGADVAIASRYVEGGAAPGLSPVRAFMSKCAVTAAHVLLPATASVSDPMSGCFAFRRDVIAGRTLKPTGFKILLEILAIGSHRSVAEVPVTLENRCSGATKMGARQQVEYLVHLLSLMRRSGELSRFLRFCLVGGTGVAVNSGLLWLLTERAGLYYLLSSCIAIETSIISNYLLNNAFTFRDRKVHGLVPLLGGLLRFNAVSLVGVGINLGVLWLLTALAGTYYLVSNLIGIALATTWNFLVNNRWTWGRAKNATPDR